MELAITALFNTIIAAFLTYFLTDASFWSYLLISQAIGISICLLCHTLLQLFQPQRFLPRIGLCGFSIISGGLLGGTLGRWITGVRMVGFLDHQAATVQTLVLSLIFGSAIGYFFFSRRILAQTREEVQQERIQRLISEKLAAEAQLKMLQAQIEPHFLFNTLSNVLSLLDTDAARGKAMLTDLTRFLRASLARTRAPFSTLASEIELSAAYLNIFKVRMGDRLEVAINLPDNLKKAPFAPMLIQPLVENAVIHGIDPLITGGRITISAHRYDSLLRVTVADTGVGFVEHSATGLGLANVRERLEALYGKNGRLLLMPHQPQGVEAVIEVPYADSV
jgi:sensor histidine kinase YesM